MSSDAEHGAWLQTPGDEIIQIQGNLSIGRSPRNSIVLDARGVSRRHAIINPQNLGEFWLIDLGSSNGTFLNKRRLHQPMRLNDRDQIVIGDHVYTFRQPLGLSPEYQTALTQQTLRQIENVPCWLLVADIENFTPLSRSLESDELAVLIGGWVAACKEIIEAGGGMIDKYLGDGFFAYWREKDTSPEQVAGTLSQLKELAGRGEPAFRLVLHHGLVAIGGVPSMGEESLMGKDVNFVFRLEKLAGSLGITLLISDAAKSKIEPFLEAAAAGCHELKGFEGEHAVFSC